MGRTRSADANETFESDCWRAAKNIADRLKASAQEQGFSNRAIAEACGVSHPTVAKWLESGDMPLFRFFQLSQALGEDPCEMAWDRFR